MSDYWTEYEACPKDWTPEEMARHTGAEVYDHAMMCAAARAAVDEKYHGSINAHRERLRDEEARR